MSQLFLILGVIGLVILYILYKKKDEPITKGTEEMVKCRTCGINIPKSEALVSGNNWFCSKEHKN